MPATAATSLEGKSAEEIQELAALHNLLLSDPKTRVKTLALIKEAAPGVQIPEIDIPRSVLPVLQRGEKMLQEANAKIAAMEAREKVRNQRSQVLSAGNIAEEDLPALEKYMIDNGIADHARAVKLFNLEREAAAPTPANTNRFVGPFGEGVDPRAAMKGIKFGDLAANATDWARTTANEMIASFQKQRARV